MGNGCLENHIRQNTQNTKHMSKLTDKIKDDLKPTDMDQAYDDMLDECYSFDCVGGIFATMSPSRVLRECDPVAYRCGFSDYVDSQEMIIIDGDYYNSDKCETIRDELLEELENQADEKQEEIDRIEEEVEKLDEDERDAFATLTGQLDDLKEELKAINAEYDEIKKEAL